MLYIRILIIILIAVIPQIVFAGYKDILVIESYHGEFNWDKNYKQGINEVLGSNYNITYFEMDTKRIPKDQFQLKAELAWKKYQEIQPTMVILGDDNALKLLGPRFKNLNVPVLYLGINNNPRAYNITDAKNITGVLERPLLKRSISLIKRINKSKNILILFDSGTTSDIILEEQFSGNSTLSLSGVNVELKQISQINDWNVAVTNAEKRGFDAIILGLYQTISDSKGEHVTENEVLRWTNENSTLPLFGFWDFSVGKDKTIGGYVLMGKEQGIQVGKKAIEILNGRAPNTIAPGTVSKGSFMFSKSQLDKWNIQLPESIRKLSTYVD